MATARHARKLRDDFAGIGSFLMFVGHPRSGHSLVGALIDAHPNAVVAHELDALKYVEAGFGRDRCSPSSSGTSRPGRPTDSAPAAATPTPSRASGRAATSGWS